MGSFGNKLGEFIYSIIDNIASKTNEAMEEARARASCASDSQLKKWSESENTILKNAADEEINRRNPYGLRKF